MPPFDICTKLTVVDFLYLSPLYKAYAHLLMLIVWRCFPNRCNLNGTN